MKLFPIFLVTLSFVCLSSVSGRENFVYSKQCKQDEYFAKNFKKYEAIRDPPKSFQQQMLVNYYSGGLDAANERFLE